MIRPLLVAILLIGCNLLSFEVFSQATFSQARHESLSQTNIDVTFDQAVTVGASPTAGWSVTLNGNAATVTSVVQFGPTAVRLTIDASGVPGHTGSQPFILPSESVNTVSASAAVGVRVSYDDGPGTLGATSFTSRQSFNNTAFSCSEIEFEQQGTFPGAPPVDNCVPVVMNFTQYQYSVSLRWRNSSTFSVGPTGLQYRIIWGDGASVRFTPYQSDLFGNPDATHIETNAFSGNPGLILTSRPTHTYPSTTTPAPDICSWDLIIWPVFDSPAANCNGLSQSTIFNNWDTDNANTGALSVQYDLPTIGETTDRVCLGSNVNMSFSDQTLLNCRVAAPETNKPNQAERHIRITYGSTNYGAPGNIPDVSVTLPAILGGGTTQVTNNNATGTRVAGAFIPTSVGVADFNGVIPISAPVTGPTLTAYMGQITTTLTNNQAVGQRFYIRLEYWDVCNPYNIGNPSNPAPVSIENYVEIISKPNALTTAGAAVCYNASTAGLNFVATGAVATPARTGVNWYNTNPKAGGATLMTNPNGTNSLNFPVSAYNAGNNAVGAPFTTSNTNGKYYSVWATQVLGGTNACESDPIEIVIIQQPRISAAPDIPTAPSGTTSVCNNNDVVYTTSAPNTKTIPASTATNGAAINLPTENLWSHTFGAGVSLTPTTGNSTTVSYNIATEPNPSVTNNVSVRRRFITSTVIPVVSPLAAPYTLPTYNINPQACQNSNVNRSVTVFGESDGGTINGSPTICDGSSTGNMTATGTRGAILQWERSYNTGAFVGIAGTGGLTTYSEIPPNGPGTYKYRVLVQNQNVTGPCSSTTTIIANQNTVTVNPVPPQPVVTPSGVTTFCDGGSVTLSSSNTFANSYRWYRNGVNTGVTTQTIIINDVAESGSYTVETVGINPTGCTSALSDPVVVTVHELPTATISGGGSICQGTPAPDIVFDLTGTGPWTLVYAIDGVAQAPVAVATSPYVIAGPFGDADGTEYDIVSVSDANTPTCTVTAPHINIDNSADVSVRDILVAPPDDEAFTAEPAVCDAGITTDPPNAILDLLPNSVETYNIGYRLLRISNSVLGPVINVNNVGSDANGIVTLTPTYAQMGGAPDHQGYQVIITSIFNVTTGCAGAVPINGPILIVNPNPSITSQPADEDVCDGGSPSFSVSATVNGSPLGYQWQESADGVTWGDISDGVVGGVTYSGAATANLSLTSTPASMNNYRYRVLVSAFGTCTTTSSSAILSINPLPSGANQTPTVCSDAGGGTTATVNLTTQQVPINGAAGLTFTWYTGYNAGTKVFTGAIADATAHVVTDGVPVFAEVMINATGCVAPASVTYTVNPKADITTPPADAIICVDDDVTFTVAATGPGITYKWQRNGADIVDGTFGGVTYSNSSTATLLIENATSALNANTFRVRTTTTGTCVLNSTTATLTVNPLPTVTNLTPTVCSTVPGGSNAVVDLTALNTSINAGAGTTTTVTWFEAYDPVTRIFSTPISPGPAAGQDQQYTVSDTDQLFARVELDATNCVNVATATYTVEPMPFNNSIRDGSGTTIATVATSPADFNICASGSSILFQTDNSVNPGSTFTWDVPAPSYPGEFVVVTASANILVMVFPNSTEAPAASLYNAGIPITVTETLNGCDGNPVTMRVHVLAAPAAPVITGPASVCENGSATYSVPFTAGSTYSWSLPPGATITSLPVTANSINVQMSSFSGNVEVVSSNGVCLSPAAAPLPVTVQPRPVLNRTVNPICSGALVSSGVTIGAVLPGTTFNWEVLSISGTLSGVNVGDNANGVLSINQTPINTSGLTASISYRVTPIGPAPDNCAGSPVVFAVTVHPEPVLNLSNKTLCSDQPAQYEILLSPANLPAGTLFSWGAPVMSAGPPQGNASGGLIPMGAAGTIHINDAFVNTTSAPITATYTISAVSGNGCSSNQVIADRQVTFTINPEPVGINTNETICSRDNFTINPQVDNLNAPGGNGVTSSFTWTASYGAVTGGAGAGSIAAGGTLSETLTNVTGLPVTVTYTIFPTAQTGTCAGVPPSSFTHSVTVDPEPVGINTTLAAICSGAGFTPVNPQTDNINAGAGNDVISSFTWTANYGAVTGGAGAGVIAVGGTLPSELLVNTTSAPINVVYTLTPTSQAGTCVGNNFTITIPVNPEPVGINTNETICSGDNFNINPQTNNLNAPGGNSVISTFTWTAIYGAVTGGAGAGAVGLGGTLSETLTNVTGAPITVIYTILPTAQTGSCPGVPAQSFTHSVTVDPEPVGINTNEAAICSGAGFTPINPQTNNINAGTGNSVTSSFTWTASYGAVTGGAGAGTIVVGGSLPSEPLRNVTSAAINVVYTLTPRSQAGGCFGNDFTITIPVNPEPVGINTNQTICSGDNFSIDPQTNNLDAGAGNGVISTFTWTATYGAVTGGAGAGVIGLGGTLSETLTNVTGLPVTVTYTIFPTAQTGSCPGVPPRSFTHSVLVNPEPVGANTIQPAICSGTAFAPINPQTNNINVFGGNGVISSFTWTASYGAVTGGAGTGTIALGGTLPSETLVNVTSAPINVVYTLTPHAQTGGCEGATFTIIIPVNPEPVGVNTNETICSGDAFLINPQVDNLDAVGGNGVTSSFTWTASYGAVTGGSGAGSIAAGGTLSETLTNVTGLPVTVTYTIFPTAQTGTCAGVPPSSFTHSVTVDPEPVGINTTLAAICSGAGFTPINPQTDNINAGAGNDVVSSFTWTANYGAVTGGLGAGVIAVGGTLPSELLVNTTSAPINVVYTLVPTSQTGGCTGDPFTITIPVNPEPVGISTSETICSGDNFSINPQTNNLNAAGGNSVISTFTWTANYGAVTGGAGGGPIGLGGTLSETLTNVTGAPITVIYTIFPTAQTGSCPGVPAQSFTHSVTVDPEPVGINTNEAAICSGAGFTPINPQTNNINAGTGNSVTSSFTWTASYGAVTGGAGAGTIVVGGSLPSEPLRNVTGAPINVVYTLTPRSQAGGCFGNTFTITIPVNPEPVLSPSPLLNATVCSELPSGVILNTIGSSVPAATYNIIAINSNGLIASAGAPAALDGLADNVMADDAWTNTSNVSVNVEYTIVPVSAAGCEGAPVVVTLTIAPQPVLSATLDVTQCSDVASGILLNTNGISVAAASYNITFLNAHGLSASAGSPAVANGAAANVLANDAWTNTTNAPVDVEYTVVPVSGSGCLGDPVVVIFTIDPEPVLDPALSAIQCSDVVSGITLNTVGTSVAAATYNIVGINSNGLTASAGSPALGSGFAANVIANDAWTNTGNAPVNVQYIVVPVSAAGCAGEPVAVVLTVNPEPVLSPTLNTTQCSDDPTGITLTTNGSSVTATTYNITSIVNNGLTASAGVPVPGTGFPANEIADDAWTNTGTTNVNVQYTIVPVSAAGCLGNPVVVTVTVRPEPILSPGLDATVCSDTPSNIILGSQGGSVAATTFSVLNIDAHGLTATAGSPAPGSSLATNAIADDVWRNTTNASVNVEYTVVPVSAAGCEGDPVVVTLTVDPEPVIVNGLDDNICSDLPVGLTLNTTPTSIAALNYNIISRTVAGTLTPVAVAAVPANGVAANYLAADVFRNTGSTALTVVYVVEPVGLINGCRGDQKTITITIDPEPVVANLDKTVCSDDVVGLTLATNGLSVGALNYNIVSRMPDPSLVTVFGAAVPISGVGTNYLFNDRFTNTTSAPLTVVYTVEPVGTINGCVGDQKIITVTINPEPVVSPALDKNVCSDNGIALMLNTDGTSVTASGYNIVSRTVDPALTQVIAAAVPANNVAANYLLGDIFRNTTAGALTVTYRVVPIGSINACVGDFRDIVITVDPEPVMAAGLNTAVCSDDPTGLVLNTNGVSVGAASYNIVSRLVDPGLVDVGSAAVPQNAVADNYLAADVFRNTGSLPLTVVYRVIPVGTINGCTGDFIDITVTINPEPVVSTTLDKSVCSDAAIGLVLNTNGASVTAPTYNIVSSNPDALLTPVNTVTVPQAGVTSTYLSGDIFRNTTNAPLDVVYVVEGVGAISGCVGDQRTITITIQPEPVLQPVAPVVCSDLPIGLVLSTTGTSAPAVSYNIVSRTIDPGLTAAPGNALVANGVSDSHLQNDQFTNTGSIDLFVTYRVEPVSADGCKGDQVDVIVTIEPEPVVDPALNKTVCSRLDVSGIILDTNGSSIGALTYDITAVVDGSLTGTATIGTGLAANAIENDVFINTTTTPLKVIYTITPNGTNGCIGNAQTVELTVRPEPVIDPALDNTVCSNNANSVNIANIILGTNGTSVGANTYELMGVTVPGTITADAGNQIVGSTGGVNLIRNDKYSNTTNAPVVVVYEIRATSADGCEGQSEFINLTINPEPIMVPGVANLCSGVASGIIVGPDAGSATITSFELKSILKPAGLVADGGNAALGIHAALPDGTSAFLANDIFTNTTSIPQVVTYTIAPLAGSCRGADQTIQFTVNPAPEVSGTLNRTVCTDDVAGIVLTTTPASAPAASYDIMSITVDAGLVVTSADLTFPRNTADVNEIASDQFSNPTDGPLTVTYDIVPISGSVCRGPVRSVVLTIEPTVKVVPVVVANSVCSNTPIDITLTSPTAPTSGTITYNYTATPSSGLVSGFLPIKNNLPNGHQITDNLVNNDDTPQTVTYRITPVAAGARNGNGCTGDFVDVVITVEPKPKLTVTPNTAAVCEGLPLSFTLTTTTVPSSGNVQFRVVGTPLATGGVTGFSPDGTIFNNNDILADVLSNPTTTAQTVTYTLLPEAPGVTCAGDAVQLIVTVHPAPVVTPASVFEQICSGANINIAMAYDVTNTIGTWTAVADANIQGASAGAGSLLFQNLFNTSSTPGNVTYTITPQSPAGCFGAPVNINVIVDPIPNVVATPTAQTICDDGTTNIALTSAVAGATFTWTVMPSSTNITGALAGSGNSISQAISNAGSFAGSVLYQVTPHGPAPTSCAGMPTPVIITVAPPVGGEIITDDVAICLGSSQLVTIMAAGQGPFSMVYNDGTSDITVNNVPGGYQFQATPTTTTTYTLVSVTDVNGCQAFPAGETLTITVGDTDASFTVVGPTNSCSPFTAQFQYNQIAGTTYSWNWGDGNLDSVYTATTNEAAKIVKHRYINTSPVGDLEVDVRLRTTVDPSQGGCFDTQTRKISVNPTITPAVFPDKTTICSGESVTFFNQTMGASSHRWFYRVQGNAGEEVDVRTTINATFNFTNTSTTNPVIYEVVYRADNGNCPEEVIVPITVYRGAEASFTEVVPEFIGGNATVTFTNTTTPIDGNDFSYEWDFGLDASPATYNGTDAVIEVDYSSPGLREIKLTVTNLNAGTAGSACVNVERKTINILMPPLVAGFTVSPKAGCFPVEVAVTSNTSTGDTFKWQVLDQSGRISATSTAPMPVFNLVNPGAYDVFLETTNTLTGQTAFAQVNGIEVFENPVASVQARPTTLFIPDTELITFNFSTGANMYHWDFDDGTTSEDFEPKHFYTLEGTYLLTLVAGNDYGDKDIDGDGITDGHVICYDTATQQIIARDGGLTKVPNAFTPSKGGPSGGGPGNGTFNDVFLPITRGVAQDDGAFIMQIFDRWGTLIFESRNQNTGWDGYDKNGNLVPAGVYVYKLDLRLADGQRTTQIGDVTVIR